MNRGGWAGLYLLAALWILALVVLASQYGQTRDRWNVHAGPWEDGSLILEYRGSLVDACIEDAACDDSRPEWPR